MKSALFILFMLVLGSSFGQNDTINRTDENGWKQGHWIYYGKDRPHAGYPAKGKIEEGRYIDDRKEGIWIKYHLDGVTPKLKGEYHNNRPHGHYWKYNEDGTEREYGTFSRNKHELIRGGSTLHNNVSSDTISAEVRDTIPPRGCVIGNSWFKPNGFNKIFNTNDDLWQEGEFKDGRLWDGKVYIYDSDGILLRIQIFKEGVYHSDGRL